MRVADLPEGPPPGVALYCPRCKRTWSATRGDYFMLEPDHEMACDCEETVTPLELRIPCVYYMRVG